MNLPPLTIEDLMKMLGERDILIEQQRRLIIALEAKEPTP